jgi:hypothetical protein
MRSAIVLFKRRVYRGASMQKLNSTSKEKDPEEMFHSANEHEESWVDYANEPSILESTSQDVFDIEDLYFDSGEALTITAAKYQDVHTEADSLLANKDEDIDHLVLITWCWRDAPFPPICDFEHYNHSVVEKIQCTFASVNGKLFGFCMVQGTVYKSLLTVTNLESVISWVAAKK